MSKKPQKYPQPVEPTKKAFMRKLVPKNISQQFYIDALNESTVVMCTGPAGSGKSFIASGIAIEHLLNGDIDKIVITRPIVEAGEKLGFLPGTLNEKIHPYLLPLLDSFQHHIGPKMLQEFMETGKIEVAPLAFMRGRTFNDCFVILDEAENTTKEQMKMFLTRLGMNTVMSINGDHTQSDLPQRNENGLSWAVSKLKGCSKEINIVEFTKSDIVRSPLIGTILSRLESPDTQVIKPKAPATAILLENNQTIS